MYTSIFLSFFVSKLWKKEEKSQIGNVPADWLLIPYAIGDVLGPFWIRIIGYVMNAGNTCPLWQRIRKMKGCGADVAKEKKEINPISQSVFFCSLPPLLDVCCWCCCRNSLATVLLFFGSTNLLLFFGGCSGCGGLFSGWGKCISIHPARLLMDFLLARRLNVFWYMYNIRRREKGGCHCSCYWCSSAYFWLSISQKTSLNSSHDLHKSLPFTLAAPLEVISIRTHFDYHHPILSWER